MKLHRLLAGVLKTTSAIVPAATALVLNASLVSANPVDGNVVAGQATISAPNSQTLHINQSTNKAIIDWKSFNIAPGETTQFFQPRSNSVTLNRIIGSQSPSQILGSLKANGTIFVINPDGILFGANSRIDVGGLVATTHDITNKDFMAGRYQFNLPGNPKASIVNLGNISIADQGIGAFVAPSVRNSGVITARLGKVGLSAANQFTLDMYGDDLIHLKLTDELTGEIIDVETGKPVRDLIKNDGTISANGGSVALTAATARKVVNSVINNTGVIEANSIGMRSGKIILGAQTAATKRKSVPRQVIKVSGTLSAQGKRKGEKGGLIAVMGEHIDSITAFYMANGWNGGGRVLIGGDYLGGNAEATTVAKYGITTEINPVPTATSVTLADDVFINADATKNGGGGKVIVWSDVDTIVHGLISAQGGKEGGNGGFVEVSGRERLAFNGNVKVGAVYGSQGTLLLDPVDATIASSGAWVITPTSIKNALNSGNVIVTTGTGTGNGDLFVAEPINWSTANELTLSAFRHVAVNANITSTGAADVIIRADKTGTGIGTITFANNAKITSTGTASLYYNPSVNSSGSVVNLTSYVNPTENFSSKLNVSTSNIYMLVNSVFDLQNIQNHLTLQNGIFGVHENFALGRNIDASATIGWDNGAGFIPIGTRDVSTDSSQNFLGNLDGLGHSINGLYINKLGALGGLFGSLSGTVKNLNIVGANITAVYTAGVLAGTISGKVINVHVTNSSVQAFYAGGLVHNLSGGSISRSSFSGSVFGALAGGLVVGNLGVIESSFSLGTVGTATNSSNTAGGLTTVNQATVSNSYSGSEIIAPRGGGLVGIMTGYGAYGPVQIVNSFSYGNVPSGLISGGLVAYVTLFASPTSVANAYWDVDTSGKSTSNGGTGLTTAQLKSGLPAGFDPSIWGIDPSINNGYPHLLWQVATAPTATTLTPGSSTTTPTPPPVTPPPTNTQPLLIGPVQSVFNPDTRFATENSTFGHANSTSPFIIKTGATIGPATEKDQSAIDQQFNNIINKLYYAKSIESSISTAVEVFSFLIDLDNIHTLKKLAEGNEYFRTALRDREFSTLLKSRTSIYKSSVKIFANLFLKDFLSESIVNNFNVSQVVADSLADTTINLLTADLKGEVIDKSIAIITEYALVTSQNISIVEKAIANAKYLIEIQELTNNATYDITISNATNSTIIYSELLTGKAWNVDTGRKAMIVNSLMVIRSMQLAGKNTSSHVDDLNRMISDFESTPISAFDSLANALTFGAGGTKDYSQFSREVATKLRLAI